MKKNNYKSSLKPSLILIFFSVCFIFLISCSDSLGIDPNVKITEIKEPSDNSEDTTKIDSETKFKIMNLWNMGELFADERKGKAFIWGDRINEDRKTFIVDTNNSRITIWVDYSVTSTASDFELKYRKDRVTKFSLKIDSLVLDLSNPNFNYGNLSNVTTILEIKRMKENQTIKLDKNLIGFALNIRKNLVTGNLEGFVFVDISPNFKFQTFKFQATFEGIIP